MDLGIKYRRIRIRTPKHNGRVERQHGLDMQRFYKRQKFESMEDARRKNNLLQHLEQYQNKNLFEPSLSQSNHHGLCCIIFSHIIDTLHK